MEQLKKYQTAAWILGILFAIATAAAGVFFNQVRTSRESEAMHKRDTQLAIMARGEAVDKLLRVQSEARTNATKYEERIAALDSKGNPALDGKGAPIFNVKMGQSLFQERLQQTELRYQSIIDEKDMHLTEVNVELQRLKEATSRPARSPWAFGLGYSAPLRDWFSLPGATWWLATAYHVPVFGLEAALRGELGVPSAGLARPQELGKDLQGKVSVDFHP